MKKIFLAIVIAFAIGCLNAYAATDKKTHAKLDSLRLCITKLNESPLDDIECAYMEIEIGNKLKDKSIIMQGNIDLGRGLYALGKYDFALQYVHKALDISGQVKSESQTADIYRLAGSIYAMLGNEFDANKYLGKAYKYYHDQRDTVNMIKTQGGLAILYGQKKKYKQSIDLFNEVYWLSYKINNKTMMLSTLLNLSKAYRLSGETDKGLNTIERIEVEIPDSILTDSYRVQYLLNKGELLLKKNMLEPAKLCFENGLEMTEGSSDINTRISLLKGLAAIGLKMEDFKLLSNCYRDISHLQDSLEDIEMKKKIMEMEFIYEITQKDKKLEKLQQQVIRNKYRLTLIAIGSITALCILLWIIRRKIKSSRKDIDSLNNILLQKKKELTDIAIYHHEMRSIVNDVMENLQKIESNVTTDKEKKNIRKLIIQLNESFSDNSKAQIYNFIDDNYSDFIQRLTLKYPDLVVSEKRICAMLLINFSTKEITNVLNLSERSINNIRSKIRKKMSIPDYMSISDFLKNV